VKQTTLLETLILEDPTVFWTDSQDLEDPEAEKILNKGT
jgi:hypothetical protein